MYETARRKLPQSILGAVRDEQINVEKKYAKIISVR